MIFGDAGFRSKLPLLGMKHMKTFITLGANSLEMFLAIFTICPPRSVAASEDVWWSKRWSRIRGAPGGFISDLTPDDVSCSPVAC